jgi:hypothetical protein
LIASLIRMDKNAIGRVISKIFVNIFMLPKQILIAEGNQRQDYGSFI